MYSFCPVTSWKLHMCYVIQSSPWFWDVDLFLPISQVLTKMFYPSLVASARNRKCSQACLAPSSVVIPHLQAAHSGHFSHDWHKCISIYMEL